MPHFVETSVTSEDGAALLDEYFAFRAASFPVAGAYRVTPPDPSQFVRPTGVFVVVYDGLDALGCGGVRMLGPSRAEIKHVWLRPEARGRRLGHTLMGELEHIAEELGATDVVLDTNSSLGPAGALYRSRGYADTAPYNSNPNANVWLRKVLHLRRRLMFVQLKTGFDADRGPSWICWVDFTKSWKTARFHGKELRRFRSANANFVDVNTHENYWLSGPKRDQSDLRYGPGKPIVDEDALEAYEVFLKGGLLPGRAEEAGV